MSCPSETRLQAFVDGDLAEAEIADLSGHLDTCNDCRTLVGVVQPVMIDEASAVDRVGRYVLRRVLGKGGMGVVYEAVDPELQRVVALKVLRSDLSAQQNRLLAEAQAMATLAHPNVVTIYDVGRDGDRVFIVMALVQGVSLRHWLARRAHAVSAIVEAFAQAGEGLRAAHEAGLVHRDFKPENVFVANDGRVVVGDFGLAMTLDTATAGEGSLAYMAPEQREGGRVDARSDQYSYCLALAEAVRGSPSVPRSLSKVLERGTSVAPEDRFPSMAALLAALGKGSRGSRGRAAALVATVAVVGIASAALWARSRDAPRLAQCRAREAEMTAIWNGATARSTEAAFRATNSPLADGAWKRASAVLGDYAGAWQAAHRRTCEAPRDPASSVVFEQKTSCLTEGLELARAVTANLAHVDGLTLEQVPAMLQLLPRVSACEDAREIAQLASPPSADKTAAVLAAKKKIASASATIAAGHYAEGLTLADDSWQAASAVGYLPVLADAYLWVGTAHGRLGHARESEQALEQAASSASAGHSPAIAIRAWIQLMHFVGFEAKRYDDGARYAEYARVALESMPGAYELEAERLSWLRAMLLDRKRFDEALVVSRDELALVELRFGPAHRLAAVALDGLAGVLAGQCKSRDALEPQERACMILEKEFGAPHPQLALCLGNLAALHANLGDHALAIATKRRALAMFEQVPGHPNHVAMAHRNLVRSLLETGRLDEAKTELESARALSQRESDEISVIVLRGELHRRQGQLTGALADHTQAVQRTQSAEPVRRLEPLLALAETSLAAGRSADALARATQAAAIARSIHGETSCRIASPLRVEAEALLVVGRPVEALPLAERALAVLQTAQVDPLARVRAELVVARALGSADPQRARQLATHAREVLVADDRDPALLARIDAWLLTAP